MTMIFQVSAIGNCCYRLTFELESVFQNNRIQMENDQERSNAFGETARFITPRRSMCAGHCDDIEPKLSLERTRLSDKADQWVGILALKSRT